MRAVAAERRADWRTGGRRHPERATRAGTAAVAEAGSLAALRVTGRLAIQSRRSDGSPSRTSKPCGPLVSYTRSGGSPPESAISRIGTWMPVRPLDLDLGRVGECLAVVAGRTDRRTGGRADRAYEWIELVWWGMPSRSLREFGRGSAATKEARGRRTPFAGISRIRFQG